jgi:cytochrome c oxidase assembly factor CtaG
MDMAGLPPLTWSTAVSTWRFAPVTDILLLVVAALYLHRAHRTLPRHDERWPIGRTALFLGALVLLGVTRQSSIDAYGHELFWLHMIEHLLLIMAVPVLVILGQPIRLACTGTDRVATRTAAVLRTPVVSFLTFPLVALGGYAAVLIGTHLTGFMQQMLTHMWVHDLEIVLYLGSGYLFFLPLLAHEPIRRQLSYPLRIFLLFLGMTVDTVVGVLLMLSAREPFPAYAAQGRTWGPDLLSDIHTGGGIMWVIGDGLMFAISVLVVAQWMRDTERQNDTGAWLESARRSTLAGLGVEAVEQDPETSIDDDDAALAAYNRMLARLNQSGRG